MGRLSQEQLQIRDAARRFAEESVRPLARTMDEEETFPRGLVDEMAAAGLFGITIPAGDGGVGADHLSYALVMEELARGTAAVADQCNVTELTGSLLSRYGSPAQKERYLHGLLKGDLRSSFAITEPGAGSDVSQIATSARPDTRGGWILDGEKIYITNAHWHDFALVLSRTGPGEGNRGLSVFIVERSKDGVLVGPSEKKMGQRGGHIASITYSGVHLEPDTILGTVGEGFKMMLSTLNIGRIGVGAVGVGICQASLDYATTRRQFGQAIADFQGIQWMLAEMALDTEASRQMLWRAAETLDTGDDGIEACAMAKWLATDAAVKQASNAVQIFGGAGYIRGNEVERLYRDAKVTQIFEGTNQIQRNIVFRRLAARKAT